MLLQDIDSTTTTTKKMREIKIQMVIVERIAVLEKRIIQRYIKFCG